MPRPTVLEKSDDGSAPRRPHVRTGRRRLRALLTGALLLLLAGFALAAGAGAQSRPQRRGSAIDPRIEVSVDQPLLVTRTGAWNGTLAVERDGKMRRARLKIRDELQLIDDYTTFEEDREDAVRTFLRSRTTLNGQVVDGPLTDLPVRYKRNDLKLEVKLPGSRWLPQELLDQLLAGFHSLWLWVELPEELKLKERFPIDLGALATLWALPEMELLSVEPGKFRYEEIDEARRVASFRGKVSFDVEGDLLGLRSYISHEADCEIQVDLREKRVLSIALEGSFRVEGQGESKAEGSGSFTLELKGETGKPLEKAQKKNKASFRRKVVRSEMLGVSLALPAHYARLDTAADQVAFIRTLDRERGQAVILLERVAGDPRNPTVFFDRMEASLRETYPDVVIEGAACALGKGRAFSIAKESKTGEKGDPHLFRSEFYPWRESYLLYRFYGPPRAFRRAMAEFARARATIRPLTR
ncbi:MAG: hypothetical protein ACE5GW_12485 [Planctomycetota bacterium]